MFNDGLPTFREGVALAPQLTARAMNAIVAAIRRNRVTAGPNQLLDQTSGGTQVWERRRRITVSREFFEIYQAAALGVSIAPGLVNSISPTFTGASPSGTLASMPPPVLTIAATTYFWLKCVGTFGAPDTYVVTVETTSGTTPPAAEAITGTGFTTCILLGPVVVSGGAIISVPRPGDYVSSNLKVESYGNINDWGRI